MVWYKNLYDNVRKAFNKQDSAEYDPLQHDWIAKAFNESVETAQSAKYEGGDPYKVEIPKFKMSQCYNLVNRSDILRTTLKIVKRETFKGGIEPVPNYIMRCTTCGKEFDRRVDECEECESKGLEYELELPNKDEYDKAIEKINKCNINGRSLTEELQEIEDDLNTVDEGFAYIFNNEQFFRLSPISFRPVLNESNMLGYQENKILLFDTTSRDKTRLISENQPIPTGYEQADYVDANQKYYNRREIIRTNKWNTSIELSFPIVMTIWYKSVSLVQMDSYSYKWYLGERAPKMLAIFNTNDQEGVKKQFDKQDKINQDQPNKPMVMAFPMNEGKKLVEIVDLSKSPAELQSNEAQNTMRRIIASVYGVTPLYISDVQTSGGLNNESQQVTITRDSLLDNINRHNKILECYTEVLGLKDWTLKLKVPEEIDLARRIEKEKKLLEIAQMKYNLGYEIDYNEDTEDWELGEKREMKEDSGFFNYVDEDTSKSVKKKVRLTQ